VKWIQRLVTALALCALVAAAKAETAGSPVAAMADPAAETGTAAAPDAATASGAAEVVETLHGALLQAMQQADTQGYQGRYDIIAPVLSKTFDVEFMAEKSVGRHWKRLDTENRELWLDTFERLTTANYAGRFNAYSGQSFETMGEQAAAHGTVVVRTKLVLPDDDDVQLNYRLRETADGWQIVDVYLNGTVSELALRRSEYSAVLKREGFDTLVAQLGQKAEDLANGTIQ